MKVRVLRSFADAKHGRHQQGKVVEMPEGADWVEAGHAERVEGEEVDVSEYHTGHGWYDVPGVEGSVREEKAKKILLDG